MNALPARIRADKPAKVKRRCPSHTKWIGEFSCSVPGCTGRPIEVAHVRTGTNGGTGLKPTDDWTISLCHEHHSEQHRIGEPEFEKVHGISMKLLARLFASKSPHRSKLMKLGDDSMRMAVR